jgi:hypothetical protein
MQERGTSWRAPVALGLMLPWLAGPGALAQAPSTCRTLLSADALAKAVGGPMEDAGFNARGEGSTDCSWMARGGKGGFRSVAVQCFDLVAIRNSDGSPAPAEFFERTLADAEDAMSAKRELVPGIGEQAGVVMADQQVLVALRRADGIARIVAHNLTKDQMIAVARAVAAP